MICVLFKIILKLCLFPKGFVVDIIVITHLRHLGPRQLTPVSSLLMLADE